MRKISTNLFKFFLFCIVFLIAADAITFFFFDNAILVKLFDVVKEKNFPSLFSTIQLLFSGYMLMEVCKKSTDKLLKYYWKCLSYIFYFLAFDEWFTVHDILGKVLYKKAGYLGDVLGWTLMYMGIMVLFAIWSIKFLIKLPRQIAFYFVLSGCMFLLGAIGFELLAKAAVISHFSLSFSSLQIYSFGLVEEGLEMLGIWGFNIAIFTYLSSHLNLSVNFPVKLISYTTAVAVIDIVASIFVKI